MPHDVIGVAGLNLETRDEAQARNKVQPSETL